MWRFYYFLVICLLSNSLPAQVNTDSLKNIIQNMPDDTSKVSIMGDLIFELSYGNKEEAKQLSDKAMQLARTLKFENGIASINSLKGVIHLDEGNLDSAQIYFLKALQHFEKIEDQKNIFNALKKIGQVHALRNSFDIAKDYYDKAFEIAQSIGDDRLLGNAYNSLGTFYINQAWHFGDNYNDSIKADSLFKQSIPYLNKATEYFNLAGYDKGVALAFANMAIIQMELDDLESSKTSMKQSAEYFGSLGFKVYLVSAFNHLAEIYIKEKNYDSALYQVEKTLALAQELDSKFDIRNAYGKYSYIYQIIRDYENYLYYHELYDDYNMQLLDQEKQSAIDELEIKYKSENQAQEIAIQKAENERQKLILIIIGIVVLSLILLTFFLIRKNIRERHFKEILIRQTEELKSVNEEMSTQRDQLEQANQKLQEANVEQSNIMAVVAHDLRSPLNKVKGLSGILNMTNLTPEQKEMNDKTTQVVEEGLDLIADIMKLKEYENDFKLNLEVVDINTLLSDTISNHQAYASRKEIQLKLYSAGSTGSFITDKIIFSRIMDNLISNAIKFSHTGSKVQINCEMKGELLIEVKGHGPGFTEDDLKHVFKRFKKLSARPTAGENSSGLGLSIVKTLIDKLNGNIEIHTELGAGSTFRLVFPILK